MARPDAPTRAHERPSFRDPSDRVRRDDRDIVPDVPKVGLFEALRRHWFVALLPVLAFVALGAAYALTRPPVYTARTTLSVVQLDLSSPGALAGFPAASQSLASAYSRVVDSESLARPVARQLRLTVTDVAARTSATPVPQSPVINVFATGDSPVGAIELANRMSRQLVRYVTTLGRADTRGRTLLGQYREATQTYQAALSAEGRAEAAYDREPTARNQARLIRLRAQSSTAKLRSDTIRTKYEQSQLALTNSTALRVLSSSRTAESDRRSKFELAVLIGLIAGLIVGAALASWRFQRIARRTALALRERPR
jgi:capsular polysaccharide biosynthesis protein